MIFAQLTRARTHTPVRNGFFSRNPSRERTVVQCQVALFVVHFYITSRTYRSLYNSSKIYMRIQYYIRIYRGILAVLRTFSDSGIYRKKKRSPRLLQCAVENFKHNVSGDITSIVVDARSKKKKKTKRRFITFRKDIDIELL